MAEYKEETKKTNWPEFIKERIGSGTESPQKANLIFGRIAWCQAFDRGDQYKILNETTGIVEDVYITRETRCIYNVCKTFNDAYAAKMWKGNPIPTTSPFSTNTEDYDDDVNIATNAAVEYWWKTQGMALKGYDITRTAAVGGIGIARVLYDKNKKSGIYTGEAVCDAVNPLHFFPNIDATNDDEIREVIYRFPKDKKVAEEEFAEKMKELGIKELPTQSRSDAHPEIAEASKKIEAINSADSKFDTVIENEIWVRACAKYPKRWVKEADAVVDEGGAVIEKEKGEWRGGRHVIVIGDYVLVDEECYEPECDSVPFFTYAVNKRDGELVGTGITYPIIPVQRDMNKFNSTISENADYMGHLKWIEKDGSVTNPAAFDDMSGERLKYTGDTPPHQSTANPLPNYISGRFWELMEIAKFLTKIQALDLGTIPKGGSQMAADTANRLSFSEEVMFSPDINRMNGFGERIIQRYLFLCKKYYKEERIVTIIGENKRPEAIAFKTEQLADNYNVSCKFGQGFARSDADQITAITNLMQTPAFGQAGIDSRLVMEELFKKMGLTKLREDTFADERQAKIYLRMILDGKDYTINEYCNPNAHIKVFTNFTKQPQWFTLPTAIKAGIKQYLDQMIQMTIGQNAPPPTPDMTGQLPPVPGPADGMNVGGRPPLADNGQGELPPPTGEI